MRRVAVLHSLAESDFEAQSWVKAFTQGLSVLGWTDGLNLQIDVRGWAGEVSQTQKLAKELIDLHTDVIVAMATPSDNAMLDTDHDGTVTLEQCETIYLATSNLAFIALLKARFIQGP